MKLTHYEILPSPDCDAALFYPLWQGREELATVRSRIVAGRHHAGGTGGGSPRAG
jgi:hypothetical protein